MYPPEDHQFEKVRFCPLCKIELALTEDFTSNPPRKTWDCKCGFGIEDIEDE